MIQRAAQLIALNKTAFNGLFRVNSKGEFNMSWGQYENPTICDSTNLRNISNILRNPKVTIGVCDYKQMLLENAKAGDFVYLDPPYQPDCRFYSLYAIRNFLYYIIFLLLHNYEGS